MKLAEINPIDVWSCYPYNEISKSLVEKLKASGWKGIPPVPVFEMPEKESFDFRVEHKYILLVDGNYRRNAAIYLNMLLPAAIFEFGEPIDIEKHKLAPFRHANDPRIYEKLMTMYSIRDILHTLVKNR